MIDSAHYGKFTAIESKLKEFPIVGFDSEDDKKGTPTIFSFYSDRGGYVTKSFTDAAEYIYSFAEPSIFVAHNLEYDINNFFKHDEYNLIEELTYAGKLLKATIHGSDHFFIDSMSFFPDRLEKMGKMVGIKKLPGGSYDLRYAETDARIVYTFMKGFQKKLVEKEKVNLGIAVGQMSMAIYRRSYMLGRTQITYNNPDILKAYLGGRVEVFFKGIIKNVIVSDINSCYPDVMQNELYPDTSKIEDSLIETHTFGVGKFRVFVPKSIFIPPLPYKEERSGRLFFPCGTFTGTWSYQEVRYALTQGVKIEKEWSGLGTNIGVRPFKEFISDYYGLRLAAKNAQEKTEKDSSAWLEYEFDIFMYKLIMNSNYGKWAQHKTGNLMTKDELPFSRIEKYIDHPDFKTFKLGPFYSYDLPKVDPPKTANFFWGVYVTSYARIKLHKGLTAVRNAGHTLVYCDTDSITYQKNNDSEPLPISKTLGDWDVEKFDLGVFQQAKGYLLCNEVKNV